MKNHADCPWEKHDPKENLGLAQFKVHNAHPVRHSHSWLTPYFLGALEVAISVEISHVCIVATDQGHSSGIDAKYCL